MSEKEGWRSPEEINKGSFEVWAGEANHEISFFKINPISPD